MPYPPATFKGTRWALQKNPWNLSLDDKSKLATLEHSNRPLYRAYLLKESLAGILDRRQPHVARKLLQKWTGWAARSRLAPFQRVGRTIRQHLDGIVASGLNNGRVEGLNGKARTITRRAYGFHNAHSLIGLLFLCCGGLSLTPGHVHPAGFH